MQKHAPIVIACRFFAVAIMFDLSVLAESPASVDAIPYREPSDGGIFQ